MLLVKLSAILQTSLFLLGMRLKKEQTCLKIKKMLRLLQNLLNLLKKKRLRLHRYLWIKPERNLKGNKLTIAKPQINLVTRSYCHLDQSISKDLLLDLLSLLILNSSTSTQINRQSRANTNSL